MERQQLFYFFYCLSAEEKSHKESSWEKMDINTEAVKEKLDELIVFYEEKNLNTLKYNMCFSKTLSLLQRARREFGANLFFILMFGPLKAGKSTLTNLLAREYVSPTGFGMETTLRPSIILKSRTKEYSIDVYEMVDPRDDQEELFNQVIDILRGISDAKAVKSRIRVTTYPLTAQTVKQQLTEPLGSEPLITILNVPGGNLVTEHIALIDMPGLDGVKSNWEESVVHKWILERADFLIFIQSSMAALNKATVDFLKDAYLGSKKPPLWLVQNVIDAKYWRSEENRKSDTEFQQKEAKNQIRSSLGIAEDLRSTAINLGKASDGIKDESARALLEESKFLDFEKNLKEILHESRVRIQQENSVKGVGAAVRNCSVEFENYREELRALLDKYDSQKKEYDEPRRLLQNIENAIYPDDIRSSLESELGKILDDWEGKCSLKLDALVEELKKDTISKAEELHEKVDKMVGAINDERKIILDDSFFRKVLNDLAQKYVEKWNGDNLNQINKWLREMGMVPCEIKEKFEPKTKPVDFTPSDDVVRNWIKKAKGFSFKKEENYSKKISELCDWIKTQYKEYRGQLAGKLTQEVMVEFKDWSRQYEKHLRDYLETQLDRKEQEIEQDKSCIESTLAYIDQLEKIGSELEQLTVAG